MPAPDGSCGIRTPDLVVYGVTAFNIYIYILMVYDIGIEKILHYTTGQYVAFITKSVQWFVKY